MAAVVQNIDDVQRFLADGFGFTPSAVGENESLGIKFAFMKGENVEIELIEPITDGPYMQLLKKGMGGFNHIAVAVDDIDEAVNKLSRVGVKPDNKPFTTSRGTIMNLDPITAHGLRLQLFKKK